MIETNLKPGDVRIIVADAPVTDYRFDQWTGDTSILTNPLNSTTTATMSTSNATITATYRLIIENIKRGILYNWYTISDSRNIAVSGWSVPTSANFQTLSTYLGGNNISGTKLREIGTTYWPFGTGTNTVGFNGRGSGLRQFNTGNFVNNILEMWTKVNGGGYAEVAVIMDNDAHLYFANGYYNYGYSIRLIKDSTTLTHGQTSSYIGNDGKGYNTICIGTQEWLSCNLAETKYRDGSNIPIISDSTQWAATGTGAICAYNNDWNNV